MLLYLLIFSLSLAPWKQILAAGCILDISQTVKSDLLQQFLLILLLLTGVSQHASESYSA